MTRLLLLASDDFFEWLTTRYSEAEYELKRTYASAVRYGRKPDEAGLAARRNFTRLLREDVVERMRPDVAACVTPWRAGRHARRRGASRHAGARGSKGQRRPIVADTR